VRLFIAVDFDEAARQAVGAVAARLRSHLDDGGPKSAAPLKWVDPAHLHLTLAFLGEIAEERLTGLTAALAPPLEVAPFEIVFGELGIFPPSGAPRVLWLGIGPGVAQLEQMQHELQNRLRTRGFPIESRPFHTHLTLARWRDGFRAERPPLQGATGHLRVAGSRVDHATLYHSVLSSSGPTYTPLARVRLKAPADR